MVEHSFTFTTNNARGFDWCYDGTTHGGTFSANAFLRWLRYAIKHDVAVRDNRGVAVTGRTVRIQVVIEEAPSESRGRTA